MTTHPAAHDLARIAAPVYGHRVGTRIDFDLTDLAGVRFGAADLVGHPTLLVFVPMAFTPICEREIGDLRDYLDADPDTAAGVNVVVITCDTPATQWAWANAQGIDTLQWGSDFWPHGAAAQRFGVFDLTHGHPLRATFLLDVTGEVAWSVVGPAGAPRQTAWYADAISTLTGPT